jgi:hypothetical protein
MIRRNYGWLVFGFGWAATIVLLGTAAAYGLAMLGSQIVLP